MMEAAADCTFPNTIQSMGSLCQVIIIMASWQGYLYYRGWLRELQPTDLSSLAFGKMSLVVEMDADCLVSMVGSKGGIWLLQSPESSKWLLTREKHEDKGQTNEEITVPWPRWKNCSQT